MIKKNIFVACDFSTQDEAVNLVEQIKNDIFGIKIGLQYITSTGIEGIKALSKFNLPIMYDGKYLDIKNTLVASTRSLKGLGVSCATVHLLNGEDALKEASKVANEISVKLIGISILTSFSDKDLQALGFLDTVEKQVEKLVKIAVNANLWGIVSSPLECKMVKQISPKLICLTPGVRLKSNKHDQKRTLSPKEAVANGSDYLIIGREITLGNPKKNIKNIINSLS
jgi:orotidine-5'-phosphate decarboxylase